MKRKGVSPVIATVLLIGIVVVIALIIFMWFRGLTEESITKFGGKNIKLVCDEVKLEASYSGGTLYISNTGTIPLYNIVVQAYNPGGHSSENLKESELLTWPKYGLSQGESFSGTIDFPANTNKIILVPILIGESKKGEETHQCEDRHGYTITL